MMNDKSNCCRKESKDASYSSVSVGERQEEWRD